MDGRVPDSDMLAQLLAPLLPTLTCWHTEEQRQGPERGGGRGEEQ